MHNICALQIVPFEVQSIRFSYKKRYLYLLEKRAVKWGGCDLHFLFSSFFVLSFWLYFKPFCGSRISRLEFCWIQSLTFFFLFKSRNIERIALTWNRNSPGKKKVTSLAVDAAINLKSFSSKRPLINLVWNRNVFSAS